MQLKSHQRSLLLKGNMALKILPLEEERCAAFLVSLVVITGYCKISYFDISLFSVCIIFPEIHRGIMFFKLSIFFKSHML